MIFWTDKNIFAILPSTIKDRYVRLMLECIALEVRSLSIYDGQSFVPTVVSAMSSYGSGEASILDLAQKMTTSVGSTMTRTLLFYSVLKSLMPDRNWNIYIPNGNGTPFIMAFHKFQNHVAVPTREIDEHQLDLIKRGTYTRIYSATEAMNIAILDYKRRSGGFVGDGYRTISRFMYEDEVMLKEIDEIQERLSAVGIDTLTETRNAVDTLKNKYPNISSVSRLTEILISSSIYNRISRAYTILFDNIQSTSTTPAMDIPAHTK
jgi:hypothetical protein